MKSERDVFVNMDNRSILDQSLLHISSVLGKPCDWYVSPSGGYDARVSIPLQSETVTFQAIVRYEIYDSLLRVLEAKSKTELNFLLVVYRIAPKYHKLLKELGVNYLEANGNALIQMKDVFILIDRFEPLKEIDPVNNRAFSKAGLRVFFQLLVNYDNLGATQRELSEQSGVALGNIPLVLKGLLAAGLLLKETKNRYQWSDKEKALDQWIIGYRNTLRSSIYQGKYRLPKTKTISEIPLPSGKSFWGGEVGGDIITGQYEAKNFMMFTDLSRIEFIKTTRLSPDPNGELEVYETFWKKGNVVEGVAPPLLVYADLILNGDKASLDTAKRVYNKILLDLWAF